MGWFSLGAILIALCSALLVLLQLYRRGMLVPVKRTSLDDLAARISRVTKFHTPKGDGPFPVVILLHGCGGVRPNMETFAGLANEAGVMAVIPDSNRLRSIGYEEALQTVCTGAKLRAHERAGDLHAVLELVRRDKRADANRVALAGWSHGGWTVLEAMALERAGKRPASLTEMPPQGLAGVQAVFAMYPYNGYPARSRRLPWLSGIPVESLLVRGDTICDDAESVAVFNRQIEWGADVKWRYVEGTTHAFDEPDHHPTSTLMFEPERAEIAYAMFKDFLKRRLQLDHGSAD
ncbi:MAG: dienelactone hydrolase [Hyphobacterium sp.]|nr:MAG: dienelactone hydrolase [Hyphobacterium sp.]